MNKPKIPSHFYNSLVHHLGEAVVGVYTDGTVCIWNQAAQQLYGYPAEEVLGSSIRQWLPPYDELLLKQSFEHGPAGPFPLTVTHREGQPLHLEVTLSPVLSSPGHLDGMVILARDSRKERLLKRRFHYQSRLLEAVNDSIIVARLDGRITYWNRGSTRLFEWEAEEIIGQPFSLLFPPDTFVSVPEHMSAIESGGWEGQSQVVTKTGNRKYARISVSAMRNEKEQPAYLVGVFSDISELVESRLAAEQANRSKSDFLANISHEIRTPMSGILGYTELLAKQGLNQEQMEYLQTIHQNGEHLLELLNELLDIAKIEAQHMHLESIPFVVGDLIQSVIKTIRPTLQRKQLNLQVVIDPHIPSVLTGDSKRIRQVVSNLLSNAVKFTEQGGITLTLEADPCHPQNDQIFPLHIIVEDTGIGIKEQQLALIFEPFTQADSSTTRKYGGTGLGLAISKRLVELMHGKISVTSRYGFGSKFMFTVPLALPGSSSELILSQPSSSPFSFVAQSSEEERETESVPLSPLAAIRVLILDDNEINRKIMTHILEQRGFQVTTAAYELDVERLSASLPYDIIMVDLNLLEFYGHDFIARLNKAAGNVPVIGLRSANQPISEGLADCLSKPVAGQQIIKAIEKHSSKV